MQQTITITKKKLIKMVALFLLFLLAFFSLGMIIFFLFPYIHGLYRSKLVVVLVCVALFSWSIYIVARQVFSTKPGLVVDDQGITDASSLSGVGFVPWHEIVDVKEATNIFKQKLILIIVKNPTAYIHKTGARYSNVRDVYYRQFNTPVVLMSGNLRYDHEKLVTILKSRLAPSGKKM